MLETEFKDSGFFFYVTVLTEKTFFTHCLYTVRGGLLGFRLSSVVYCALWLRCMIFSKVSAGKCLYAGCSIVSFRFRLNWQFKNEWFLPVFLFPSVSLYIEANQATVALSVLHPFHVSSSSCGLEAQILWKLIALWFLLQSSLEIMLS